MASLEGQVELALSQLNPIQLPNVNEVLELVRTNTRMKRRERFTRIAEILNLEFNMNLDELNETQIGRAINRVKNWINRE